MTLTKTFLEVKRSELVIDYALNRRWDYGDLERQGRSLEQEGQIDELLVTKRGDKYVVRDGLRRVTACDHGFAPEFTKRDRWRVAVLTMPNGATPPDDVVFRYCAASNRVRKNWTPMEEAYYYQQMLNCALKDRQQAARRTLTVEEREETNTTTMTVLSTDDGVHVRTVKNRLALLNLPEPYQQQVARGNLKPDAALAALKTKGEDDGRLDDKRLNEALAEAAKLAGVNLENSSLPGDRRLTNSNGNAKAPRIHRKHIVRTLSARGVNCAKAHTAAQVEVEIKRIKSSGKTGANVKLVLQTLEWVIGRQENLPL